jgi:DNA-binding IclR family transcriptional regulator
MVGLTKTIGWPCDLHLYHHGRMQIIESTHALGPLEIGGVQLYDLELNLFAAASGLAYLSTLPDAEIDKLITELCDDPLLSLVRFRISRIRLFQEVERARSTGFGRRLVEQTGACGYDAIAYPIRSGSQGVGALSVWWPYKSLGHPELVRRYGNEIRDAAGAIEAHLRAVNR